MIYFGIPPSRLLGSIGHLAKLDTSKVGLQHVLRIKHPRVSPEKGWIFPVPTQIYHNEGDSNIQWTWNPLHSKHEKKIRTSNEHKMKHNRGHVDRQLPEGKRMGADFQCFWKEHTIRSTCELSNKHILEFTTPNPPKTHITPLKDHQASPRYAANSWTNQCTSPHPCGCRYNRHLAPGS